MLASAILLVSKLLFTSCLQDWIQDLKFSFTVPIDNATCPGCEVHQGFNQNYVALRPQIIAALQGMDTSRGINIAGHSLGAAVSVLAAWDLVRVLTHSRSPAHSFNTLFSLVA